MSFRANREQPICSAADSTATAFAHCCNVSYLCTPSTTFGSAAPFGMVTDAHEALNELGVEADRVHQELFFVEDAAPAPVEHAEAAAMGPVSDVRIVLDGASSTLAQPRDASILDAAQRSRDDLPFACKGGVCGTCRAKVTDGAVDMRRNYALEPAEVDAGFVLTCQSYPTTDSLTVDFDA